MRTVVVGLNYHTAPIELREKIAFSKNEIPIAMKDLNVQKGILENILISTCNRTEVYAVLDAGKAGLHSIKKYLSLRFDVEIEELKKYLFIYEGNEASQHLFRVTCGLDSMVLGETQILGQVKESFFLGQEHKTTGVMLNKLVKQAITLAKRAHTETEINTNAVSISYAAVELSKKVYGSMADQRALIIGTGEMGNLAAENLYGSKVAHITLVNRTYEKAVALAPKFKGSARKLEELYPTIQNADIVISSTSTKGYVVTKEELEPVMAARNGKQIVFLDIAVPRDIDPKVSELENVILYDVDDLNGVVEANLEERKVAAVQIEEMIKVEVEEFNNWVEILGVVPVISGLKTKAQKIQTETMLSLENKLPSLSDREWKVINKHVNSIMNQMLKDPVKFVKDASANREFSEHTLGSFIKIFNIEEEVKREKFIHEQKLMDKESKKENSL